MIVYDEEQMTFKLSHTIPAETLVNGKSYNCSITVYDIDDNNITSGRVSFLCFQTPMCGFQNITQNQIIKNYTQMEGELINEYRLMVYTTGLSVFWDSEILYGVPQPINIKNLADNVLYYLRATGKTVNGILLDTGFVPITVKYEAPMLFSVLSLENKMYEGIVNVSSNIVAIT